jgi:outer membrane protein assembly factor BamB
MAGEFGGAIAYRYSSPTFTNCTITGNTAEYGGGGIFCETEEQISLTNCILWGNVDSGAPIQPCQIFGGTPEVMFSCIQDDDPNDTDIPFGDANGNIDDNPMFVRNPDDGGDGWGVGDNDDFGDLHLQNISPCINTGMPNFAVGTDAVDIDGQPRIIGLRIDMGADEYEKMIVVTIPQGGQVWTAGSTHEIQWSGYGAGAVDILFSADSGGDWQTIESSTPDTESYIWQLPNKTDSNQCVISVVPGIPDANVITIESGSFEICRYRGPASLPQRQRPPGPRPGEQYGPEFGCVKWKFETDGPVTSAVTIGRKIGQATKAYIACEDGKLYALDIETGSLIWSYDINSPLLGSAAEGPQGAVYAGSTGGRLYAIDKNGQLLWTHTTEEPIYSTPVVSPQGRIYICSQDGTLYALARDGSELWCFETDGSGVTAGSIFATPAIADDGTVYIGGLYDPNLYALNSNDGSIKWNCNFVRAVDLGDPFFGYSQILEKGGWPFASPVIAEDGTIYQGLVYAPNLYAIDPNDGSKIWSTSLAGTIIALCDWDWCDRSIWYGAGEPPDVIDGRLVYILGKYLYNSCWSRPALAPDGTIYVSFDDPYLRAVDPNGSIKWMAKLGEVGGFTLTVGGDGLIYAASDDANLYVVDPNGQKIAQFQGDDWLSHPVIAPDRTIIVSDANNTVWAISENACDGQEPVLDIPASKSEPNEQKTNQLPTEPILSDSLKRKQNAGGNR